MHRSIAFLPPLLLLTAFLLAVATIISPTILFKEQVSLLRLGGNVSVTTRTISYRARRWAPAERDNTREGAGFGSNRFSRFPKGRTINSHNTVLGPRSVILPQTTQETTALYIGLMGSCSRVPTLHNSSHAAVNCSSSSLIPKFTAIYQALSIPESIESALPAQFPIAPSVISLATGLLGLTFLLSIYTSLPSPSKVRKERQAKMRKFVLTFGFLSFVIGLAASLALRIGLQQDVNAFNSAAEKLEGSQLFSRADLGSGFTQLFAVWTLDLLGVIMLNV